MKTKTLFVLWGGLFILCAALGFIPHPAGALKILLTLAALLFFLPPALLLHRSKEKKDKRLAKLVRNLCVASLVLTAVLLMVPFLCVLAPVWLGNLLHILLTVGSTPMICCGNWALSMFLWACLMICSMNILKEKYGKT